MSNMSIKSHLLAALRTTGRMNSASLRCLARFSPFQMHTHTHRDTHVCVCVATSCGSNSSGTSIAWQFREMPRCSNGSNPLWVQVSPEFLCFWNWQHCFISVYTHTHTHTRFDISSINSRRKLSFDFAKLCFIYFTYFTISKCFYFFLYLFFFLSVFYCNTQPWQILTFLYMTENT